MKIVLYIILALVVIGLLTYFLGDQGLLAGLLGGGLAGSKVLKDLKKKGEVLDAKADAVKEDLAQIEKAKEKLKKDGVEGMTPEEEVEYWKNQ